MDFCFDADISLDLDFGGMKKKKKKKKAFDMDDVGEALPVSVDIWVIVVSLLFYYLLGDIMSNDMRTCARE